MGDQVFRASVTLEERYVLIVAFEERFGKQTEVAWSQTMSGKELRVNSKSRQSAVI